VRALVLLLAFGLVACPSTRTSGDDDDTTGEPADWDSSGLPVADDPAREPLSGSVNFVLDGDTFDLEFSHGAGSDRVRVLAINTPETNADDPWGPECWAEEAKDRAQELLAPGTDVWLTFDGEVEDNYGRLLAYVYFGRAPTDIGFEDSFNYAMVREGHAYTYFFDNNRSFEDTLRSAEQQAMADDLGVWNCN
jgi:micrococcal nuclease